MPDGIQHESLIDRTLRNIRIAWRDIARSGAEVHPDLQDDDIERLRRQMTDCLSDKGGEVSARSRAAALGQSYIGLNVTGRERFLRLMASEFGPDRDKARAAAEALAQAPEDKWFDAREKLRRATEAPWLKLFTQFNDLPDGIKFLVDMRADLLGFSRTDPLFKPMERDLRNLLSSWFDVGFLELRQITWESSAALLEKLIAYEAVHEIASWTDLKNRLDSDRRCFAYIHPRMPDEPLIFVEVALVNGMAANVQDLLDEDAPVADPDKADTAIFYSISNAQKGLAGISFGNFLIKRVVGSLSTEFPNLKTFATLSPIPGFRKWLDGRLAEGDPKLLTPAERKELKKLETGVGAKGSLKQILSRADWPKDEVVAETIKGPLMRLCVRYLTEEKRSGTRALDPVAHFHLTNGARMERLNWLGDVSPKGISQAAGLMINYLYKLGDIDGNHEVYTGEGKIVTASRLGKS
jgi:malonyl-CoA decarboxylase